MGPGGALEACIEAREQGLVKYIGVTGHDVAIVERHFQSLERFDFDSVLLPYNYIMMQNPVYAAGFERVLAVCRERDVAVQTIKSITWRPYPNDQRTHATWYAPMTAQSEIDLAVHWVLGQEVVFLNTAGDIHLLPKVLDAAARFAQRPPDAAMDAQVERLGVQPLFT
jgi:predicted aldo/keto reductase-like oxidoreductase